MDHKLKLQRLLAPVICEPAPAEISLVEGQQAEGIWAKPETTKQF